MAEALAEFMSAAETRSATLCLLLHFVQRAAYLARSLAAAACLLLPSQQHPSSWHYKLAARLMRKTKKRRLNILLATVMSLPVAGLLTQLLFTADCFAQHGPDNSQPAGRLSAICHAHVCPGAGLP
jgi:hypothetical protein